MRTAGTPARSQAGPFSGSSASFSKSAARIRWPSRTTWTSGSFGCAVVAIATRVMPSSARRQSKAGSTARSWTECFLRRLRRTGFGDLDLGGRSDTATKRPFGERTSAAGPCAATRIRAKLAIVRLWRGGRRRRRDSSVRASA